MGKFLSNLVGKGFLIMTENPDVISLTLIYLTIQKQTFAWQKQKQKTHRKQCQKMSGHNICNICQSSMANILKYKELLKSEEIKTKIIRK